MTDDATEAPSLPERTGLLGRLAPKPQGPVPDRELRANMRSLDLVERKWGFFAGVIPLLVALIAVSVHQNVKAIVKLKNGHCPLPAHLVDKVCVGMVPLKASVPLVILQAALGVVIIIAVWRSLRVLTVVSTILAGLASGLLGVVAIFYGGWLLLRSWRLQRYGATDGATVRKVVAERAGEKRAARKAPKTEAAAAAGPRPVTQSKRYTPKAKPRKR